MSFYVEIIAYEDQEPVHTLGPFGSKKIAEKADNGLTRQLDHERFYTSIVEKEDANDHSPR